MKLFLALIVLACAADLRAQSAGVSHGPYHVGYRATYSVDRSRSFPLDSVNGRPVFIQVWYPASPVANSKPMRYGDFIDAPLDGPPLLGAALRARTLGIHRYVARKYFAADSAGLIDRFRALESRSFRDAPAQGPRFPILVYGAGAFNSTEENTPLWEALASHGYVVVAVPSQGAFDVNLRPDAAGLETQARDMEYALSYAATLPMTDPKQVGMLGFSYSAAAALVAAMRNRSVRAVVALDGSFMAPQYQAVVRGSPLFDVDRLTIPVLEIHRADTLAVTFDLLQDLRYALRLSGEITDFNHIDFNAYNYQYANVAKHFDASIPRRVDTYKWMVERTVAFVDVALKGDSTRANAAGLQVETVGPMGTTRILRPLAAPPSAEDILRNTDNSGADRAVAALKKLKANDPRASVLSEASINSLGYTLLDRMQNLAAVQIFLLNLEWHPESANALDSAADGFRAAGQLACAAAAYRKLLDVAGRDRSIDGGARASLVANATKQLQSLGPQPECSARRF